MDPLELLVEFLKNSTNDPMVLVYGILILLTVFLLNQLGLLRSEQARAVAVIALTGGYTDLFSSARIHADDTAMASFVAISAAALYHGAKWLIKKIQEKSKKPSPAA